jgi:hypothetical protein
MTIQEVINKAVEGGYHIHGSDGTETFYEGATSEFSAWTRTDNESSFMIPTEETFLDLHFWQALGQALAWSEACHLAITCTQGHEECQRCRGYYWTFQWHRFIQALADGNTPAAFFAPLPSSPPMASGNQHQAGRDPSLERAFQRVSEIQQKFEHIYTSAQRAYTKAHLAQQTAQATRAQCQQTRHIRAMIRQVFHGEGGYGHRSPEGHSNALHKGTSSTPVCRASPRPNAIIPGRRLPSVPKRV